MKANFASNQRVCSKSIIYRVKINREIISSLLFSFNIQYLCIYVFMYLHKNFIKFTAYVIRFFIYHSSVPSPWKKFWVRQVEFWNVVDFWQSTFFQFLGTKIPNSTWNMFNGKTSITIIHIFYKHPVQFRIKSSNSSKFSIRFIVEKAITVGRSKARS